jgi:hypothetical protein
VDLEQSQNYVPAPKPVSKWTVIRHTLQDTLQSYRNYEQEAGMYKEAREYLKLDALPTQSCQIHLDYSGN